MLLGVRLPLEVGALLAVGYCGYRTGQGTLGRFGMALGAPFFVAVVWGLFGAPPAPYRLGGPWRLGLELAVFAAATGTL